ncbi:MAG: DUF3857 and transglutaminase domain-containing protein [Crocinitomicaceae bacterium]|nr:DUF3857 and transglutaminase domain-containing protein [Crocinitomicaceae bacterium]
MRNYPNLNIRKGIFVFIALFFAHLSFAKDVINVSAYQEKYPDDLGVILDHSQTVSISVGKTGELIILETNYEDILYLKNSARFYTNESISLSEFFESVISVSASVITAEGKTRKLKPEDFRTIDSEPSSWVFHDDDKEMIFDLVELRAGYRSIISHTKKLKKPEFFDSFHLISGFPLVKSTVSISFPQSVNINFYERAFGKYNIKKSDSTVKGIRTVVWEMGETPAYKSEEGSTAISNHIPHILAQITSYQFNGQTKELIGNVEQLHAFFEEFLLQKDDESNRKEINEVTTKLIEEKQTDEEKIDTIYKWVQDNIKYIAFEDGINGYVPRACSEVMKNRYGDCKDMSNLLVEMLTFAGVKNAFIAWVGTRDIPYQMSEIPSPLTCNHVICVVEKEDGSYYYLDATGSEMGHELPPSGIQEKEILVHMGPGKFKLYKVPAVAAETNYFKTVITYTFDENDSLRGSGVDYLGGYERESESYSLKNLEQEDLYDYVKDMTLGGRNRYTLLKYQMENVEDNNKELILRYDFSVDNLFTKHENDYIMNPLLFKPRVTQFNAEDYKQERKKNHHRTVQYEYHFNIPAGFKLTYIPQGVDHVHDLFEFHSSYALEGNTLVIKAGYLYRTLAVTPDLFDEWNAFSDAMNKSDAQNIILQKI